MNLPATAIEFLPHFRNLFNAEANAYSDDEVHFLQQYRYVVHVHSFSNDEAQRFVEDTNTKVARLLLLRAAGAGAGAGAADAVSAEAHALEAQAAREHTPQARNEPAFVLRCAGLFALSSRVVRNVAPTKFMLCTRIELEHAYLFGAARALGNAATAACGGGGGGGGGGEPKKRKVEIKTS